MKKILLGIFYIIFFATSTFSENKINPIYEGSSDAKIELIVYESLTCSHCADFHKNVYPDLKENFIDKGYVKIEFRNFPLDLAALNAEKVLGCVENDEKKLKLLNELYKNQDSWASDSDINSINQKIFKITNNYGLNNDKNKRCLNDQDLEDEILNERINASKKYSIEATPTIFINEKKYSGQHNYENFKKEILKYL